ncbi:uncharacterized protein LOC116394208 isoform X1 [Anarrhichthys ocellatus]|uniref:uncharacterized protein LOC116394208 isoform X1 n=1 Tax=Anarrhichthys ocellatus TaxID=433405 RepID=UPI0012ED75C1|nr:uncharacterized protein LOC116394208 isoform X1 [Anarrhichthys ocellatus]XP_031722976.1 uncharacterized protein LOC116394208 isoform X1 [Anarrhichthys ocellatus]XP_031722977.1 uncharacterized protein LOC116394208 isoform X1 [Anarrhichthys ocellatus]XP_031722978.1 uncharacterized protein LOC116394208 isoform X1 [Anarrhichthys ocellatus]XP_031722979.1 uncharacterized protein LOC116394208 isoform X1 [Anarrhichthys ocellatus]XP_031722980.1 uncharacterized protein LOC116394208 isoform X1 [Anarrh
MNPLDWDHGAVRSFQRGLSPNHQNDVYNSMEDASVTNEEWHTFCKYARRTADETQSSMGWEELSLPLHNVYTQDSEVEDADGEALEMDEEDPELARKRKELREIEEQILLKKAAIALKTVEPFVKSTTSPDFSCNESASCIGATLRDRVNLILKQQHPASCLSKVRSPKERMNSSRLSKDGLLQDDHPLKLRVKALMKRRCSDPFVLPASIAVPDLTPPPSSPSITSPDNENSVNEGFLRFLSVLNKGVDMDFLSRIVNDDSVDLPLGEELLNIPVPGVENKSDPTLRRESQQSDSGASLPGSCGERKSDPPSQERSLSERLSPPNDDEKKNDRSRSKSPSAVKQKEEEKTKVDEQREQLQNILKSLGLSLEVEEMSKLADRTQERLYGKKHEDTRVEQESRQRGSQRHYSNCSSSSRSSSRSNSPSPSRRWRSLSREPRRRSEHSDRRGDGLTRHDGNEDSKEEQRYRDEGEKYPKEISSYQHLCQQNHTNTQPDNSLPQDSLYTADHSGINSADLSSYWAPTQGAIPPFFYTSGRPIPQNTYQSFPGSVVAPNVDYPHQRGSFDINLFVNPDLSKSEGQTGSASGSRCLQVISTEQPQFNIWKRQRQLREIQMVEKVEAPQLKEDDTKAEQSEEKRPPTDKEIKANLRKKLEAFNQKMKQKVTQPANSLSPQTG